MKTFHTLFVLEPLYGVFSLAMCVDVLYCWIVPTGNVKWKVFFSQFCLGGKVVTSRFGLWTIFPRLVTTGTFMV